MTEKDEGVYQEMIAHLLLCLTPSLETVLVTGGGDGGFLGEISRHSFVSKRFFLELAIGFEDPRVCLHVGDAVEFFSSCSKKEV